MNLYLLRHGISVSNEQSLVCGASDYPLSERGKRQAKKICQDLNRLNFSHIYCSPLTRARQTIEYLDHPIDIKIVPDLIELNTGAVSHITVAELYDKAPLYRYQGLSPDLKYPDGECLNEMLARVISWFDAEKLLWTQQDSILIAGHEGTVCAILHHMLNLNIAHYPTFSIGNCDYVHVVLNAEDQIRYRFVSFVEPAKEIEQ